VTADDASDGDPADEGLQSLTALERKLFGKVLRVQFATKGSKVSKNLDRYGPAGSAQLFTSVLWGGPVWILVIAIGIVGFLDRNSHPYDAIVPLICTGCLFLLAALYRMITGVQEGRRFRRQQPHV
jgi:hypothetical protein